MESLRVALAQLNMTVGDLPGNREKIAHSIEKARQAGTDIVAFSELALCGYPPEDLLHKPSFLRDTMISLEQLIPLTSGITVLLGYAHSDNGGNIYNSSALLHDGQLLGRYDKMCLPNYGVFDEKRYFVPGVSLLLFQRGAFIIGVTICEDIWVEDDSPLIKALNGKAHVIFNLSSSPYHAGKIHLRRQLLEKRVKETGATFCYVNQVGGQDELVFDGGSMVIDSEDQLLCQSPLFEEDILFADLSLEKRDLRLGGLEVLQLPPIKQPQSRPAITLKEPRPLDKIEEIYSALVLGTRDYTRKNRFKKVLIGLSGGIDSCLTAVIATDALGKENVVGVSMPSRYTPEGSRMDAKKIAENLGIALLEIPLEPVFEAYCQTLKPFLDDGVSITYENIQARIRGNFLMALSNNFGWLVLTTGNKSEYSVGYCTLYGDMVGGFGVLKDVFKGLVYKLANYKNQKSSFALIPQSVIEKEPSAELKHGQKDTDTLPAYPILDPILEAYVEQARSFHEIKETLGVSPGIIKKAIEMVDRSEYKRRQGPPGIKITPKAFGKDWRFPITNLYKECRVHASPKGGPGKDKEVSSRFTKKEV